MYAEPAGTRRQFSVGPSPGTVQKVVGVKGDTRTVHARIALRFYEYIVQQCQGSPGKTTGRRRHGASGSFRDRHRRQPLHREPYGEEVQVHERSMAGSDNGGQGRRRQQDRIARDVGAGSQEGTVESETVSGVLALLCVEDEPLLRAV